MDIFVQKKKSKKSLFFYAQACLCSKNGKKNPKNTWTFLDGRAIIKNHICSEFYQRPNLLDKAEDFDPLASAATVFGPIVILLFHNIALF